VSEFDSQMMTLSNLADDQGWVGGQQLRLAFENSMLSLTANIFCAFVIVILLWPLSQGQGLIAWLGSICVLTLIWLILQQKFDKQFAKQNEISNADFPRWRNAFIACAAATGCAWGVLSLFMFPEDSTLHQAYLTFVLAAVCASAVTAYAPLPYAFPAFAVPVLMPYAYSIWSAGSPQATLMASLVTAFMYILLRTASQSRRNVEDILSLQVKNADLTRALHHRATHDSLVELINHGEFNRRLDRLAMEERREGSEYCLIFIDLDLFKAVNDNGGHAAGDKILQGVATILKRRTRATDTVARVGGDEFALLLEGCPHHRAEEIGEAIRKDIAELTIEHDQNNYSVQASLGISFGESGTHSASAMLKAADAACYAAKQQGRNRVHINKASDLFAATDRFEITRGSAS
jgi:diguanylate cyclase (GGDEF)-like protein